MLVLVSGATHDYCGRLVEMLQMASHRVVFAASTAARARFLERTLPDAVIHRVIAAADFPDDLVHAVGAQHIPVALLTDADESTVSQFLELGFQCFGGDSDLARLDSWLKTLPS